MAKSRFDGTCAFCGADGIYVKSRNLCRNCYERFRRHGTPEYEPSLYDIGKEVNGWKLIYRTHEKKSKFYLMCVRCGLVKKVTDTTAHRYMSGKTMDCKCKTFYAPRTERQSRIVQTYKDCNYNEIKTARELGITRQAVSAALRSCEIG